MKKVIEVFCEDCKYSRYWEMIYWDGWVCLKKFTVERNAVRSWKLHEDCKEKNSYNNCKDYKPSLWKSIKDWFGAKSKKLRLRRKDESKIKGSMLGRD